MMEAKVSSILKQFDLKVEDYQKIKSLFEDEIEKGLLPEKNEEAEIKMLPSFVTKLPTGEETGQYLALTLGNKNCHLILVTLTDDNDTDIVEKVYAINDEMKKTDSTELFKFIASNVKNFLDGKTIHKWPLKMGLTFTFPCKNTSLSKAILVKWSKEFAVSDCEGKDIVFLLQTALDHLDVKVKCVAVINDTVANLIYCAHHHEHCFIGVIVGTGTNAAYLEDIDKVKTFKGSLSDKNIVINMEWGAFGDRGSLDEYKTEYDKQLDKESLHPQEHIYEKMISGMYIGELVRIILLDLIKKKLLFGGKNEDILKKEGSFQTSYISEIERDLLYNTLEHTYNVLNKHLGVVTFNNTDAAIIKDVCQKVITRAAYLVGTGIACLLNRVNQKQVTIAIDGSLYKFHPKFEELMIDMIYQFKEPDIKFELKASQCYKGEGAAILAATLL